MLGRKKKNKKRVYMHEDEGDEVVVFI